MKRNIIVVLCVTLLVGAFSFVAARYEKLYNPIVKGDASGIPGSFVFSLADDQAAADLWLLGDTTTAGRFEVEQPIQITDVKIFGDPDNGDTCCVKVYAFPSAHNPEAILAPSDSLYGTSYTKIADMTSSLSSTYKTVTTTEYLAVLYDFIDGTPNKVTVVIEYVTRIADAYE